MKSEKQYATPQQHPEQCPCTLCNDPQFRRDLEEEHARRQVQFVKSAHTHQLIEELCRRCEFLALAYHRFHTDEGADRDRQETGLVAWGLGINVAKGMTELLNKIDHGRDPYNLRIYRDFPV